MPFKKWGQVYNLPHNQAFSLPHIENTGGGPPPPPPIKAGLLHWWYFEEPNGVDKQDLVSGVNLVLTGFGGTPVESQVPGLVNEGTQVAFQSLFTATSVIDLSSPKDFTIVGVFKFNSASGNLGIISQANPTSEEQWYIAVQGGVLRLAVSHSGTVTDGFVTAGSSLNDNAYHTYIAWRDSTNNIIALALDSDGTTPATAAYAGSHTLFTPLTGHAIVGGIGPALFINGGTFDETGIWDRVLTQAERTFLYNGGAWRTYSDFT